MARVAIVKSDEVSVVGAFRHIATTARRAGAGVLLVGFAALSAAAQSDGATGGEATLPNSPGLSLNMQSQAAIDRIADIDIPRFELPVEAIGSTLFKLDLSDTSCLSGEGSCRRRDADVLGLGLTRDIAAKKDDGIDLVLRPRASFQYENDGSSSALVGAVVEIGEDLRVGSEFSANTWYLFAGADAEALTYSPDSLTKLNSGNFHLQDRIIVGDAQAGVGYRIGDADVSVSYLRREAQAEGISFTEDAAALSFTWKR